MIPKDKFGKPIYSAVFSILKKNEKILLLNGYIESNNKPNLFYKKLICGYFYTDMRGTEEVPIWFDTRPLFYWKFNSNKPKWERRRLIKAELLKLFNNNCPCRLSFYAFCDSEDFENTGVEVDEENGIFVWDDGCCRFCSKDFKGEGSFCSKTCEEQYENTLKTPCAVCGEKIDFLKEVRHHISYFPEKIIFVHASCHNLIHKTNKFLNLKPDKDEINRFYKK